MQASTHLIRAAFEEISVDSLWVVLWVELRWLFVDARHGVNLFCLRAQWRWCGKSACAVAPQQCPKRATAMGRAILSVT